MQNGFTARRQGDGVARKSRGLYKCYGRVPQVIRGVSKDGPSLSGRAHEKRRSRMPRALDPRAKHPRSTHDSKENGDRPGNLQTVRAIFPNQPRRRHYLPVDGSDRSQMRTWKGGRVLRQLGSNIEHVTRTSPSRLYVAKLSSPSTLRAYDGPDHVRVQEGPGLGSSQRSSRTAGIRLASEGDSSRIGDRPKASPV